MGLAGSLPMTADDYPGAGPRTQTTDGHFVTVKATVIATAPEPETGGLFSFGVLLLALRCRVHSRR